MRDPGGLEGDVDDPLLYLVGTGQRGSSGKLEYYDQIAAVDLRDEPDRRLAEFVETIGKNADIENEHNDDVAHGARNQPVVTSPNPIEAPVEAAEKLADRAFPPLLFVALRSPFEEQGAHRRRQRQRHDQGNDSRTCDGESELTIELAGNARDEGGGNEHRAQNQGDRDQRSANLVHAL